MDSLILRFLKDATAMAESDLFSKLEAVVKFSITKEFFQSRLQTLEKRRFLAKETNEMWKYIP
jgi:ATP:corrinoid adenosyltransferase